MKLFLQLAVAVCAIAATGVQAQPEGQYNRPDRTTGRPDGRNLPFRSPCPALNTLANHGHLPRDGRNLTPHMLREAVKKHFNVDQALVDLQTSGLPGRLTLADLSKHNLIEHDASLVHADEFYRQDPAQVDGGLANDLLGRAVNGELGIREVGIALRDRLVWCQQKPPKCDFKSGQRDVTFREGANLVQTLGGRRGSKINVNWAYSFLVLERFPSDWQRPRQTTTLRELDDISRQIQRVAGVQ
jgi:hypothetical protein